MPEQPVVTIAIANFNYASFVDKAIRSALTQTYPRTQVIVVDDGSTDDSREVITAELQRHAWSATVVFKPNAGHGSVYNTAFERGSGDVFIFLDSDDVLLPDAAARVAQACTADVSPTAARPVTRWSWQMPVIRGDAERPAPDARLEPRQAPVDGDQLAAVVQNGPPVPGSSPASGCAWPRWFLERTLPMPEPIFRRAADSYLNTLAPLYGTVRYIEEPLSYYRDHGNNFWAGKSAFEKARTRSQRFGAKRSVLTEHLDRLAIPFDPGTWGRGEGQGRYWEQVERLERQLLGLLSLGAPFILADQDEFNIGSTFHGRRRYHLMEREGCYWGLPADDERVIAQLESHREAGARHCVFLWPTFWWLDHYSGLALHLKRYRIRFGDSTLKLFDLG